MSSQTSSVIVVLLLTKGHFCTCTSLSLSLSHAQLHSRSCSTLTILTRFSQRTRSCCALCSPACGTNSFLWRREKVTRTVIHLEGRERSYFHFLARFFRPWIAETSRRNSSKLQTMSLQPLFILYASLLVFHSALCNEHIRFSNVLYAHR